MYGVDRSQCNFCYFCSDSTDAWDPDEHTTAGASLIHSIQIYLCSAFHDINSYKAALQKINVSSFSNSLSAVTVKLMSI